MNNTVRLQFFFGVGLDRKGNPIPEAIVRVALQNITHSAMDVFGGCTMLSATGGWCSPRGQVFYEETRCLMMDLSYEEFVAVKRRSKIRKIANLIRKELNQESVHVTWQTLNSEYYGN